MAVAEPKCWAGYDPDTDTSYLLTVYDNGEREVAVRAGQDATEVPWSAPVPLEAVRP